MARHYVREDGLPGRPKTRTHSCPPKGFSLHKGLMRHLDPQGWYEKLEERRQLERAELDPPDPDYPHLKRVTDPKERDSVMCRSKVVAVCTILDDLEVAQINRRLVLEIDPACPDKILFKEIAFMLKQVRNSPARKINTKAWADHRILALYDLILMGYDPSKERKQLAAWLFPEIRRQKSQGDKFDRAVKYLNHAISVLPELRAQSSR